MTSVEQLLHHSKGVTMNKRLITILVVLFLVSVVFFVLLCIADCTTENPGEAGLSISEDAEKTESSTENAYESLTEGDILEFGMYEQDNNSSNGKEPIEWIILEKEENKILVISKYALDCKPYHSSWDNITWNECSLRRWLNGTFYNQAFDESEKEHILSTHVKAERNPGYDTNPGSSTTDKVFLLSVKEVNKYFSSDKNRKCTPTDYAIAQESYTNKTYTKQWWLRSPGPVQYYAALVDQDGSVSFSGYGAVYVDRAVRPTMWIDMDGLSR